MPSMNDEDLALARVYSIGMLELAEAKGEVDRLREELLDLAAYRDRDAELESFLYTPTVDTDTRRKVLEKLFRGRYSDLCVDSLQVLNRKQRLGLIRGVAEAYRLLHEDRQGLVEVQVRTATPLSEGLRDRLREVTTSHTGKETVLVETVDDSLLGGMIVRIGDERFDLSVAARLRSLCRMLLDRASREIHSGRTFCEGTAG